MMKNIEKMNFPVVDEEEGEILDLGSLYEGMHIKERVLKIFSQESDTMTEAVKSRIAEHMKICPRNEKTGRPSCQEKYEEYRLKQQSLIE